MSLIAKDVKTLNKESPLDNPLNFISAGVACYAFSLIDELGLLDLLVNDRGLPSDCFGTYPNPIAVMGAVRTLESNNVIFLDKDVFRLTSLGESLIEHRSSIGLIYNGYRKVLADQTRIAKDEPFQCADLKNLIDERAISKAASYMGATFFNRKLIEILKNHSINGKICDLGCGNAATLISICSEINLPGLGFDFSESSIEEAKKSLSSKEEITLLTKDICNINETYVDVEVLIQSFVMHDFSNTICKKMFASFKKFFPRTKIFLYIDAVSPEQGSRSQLPGFDYVHSLFGVKPRTFNETSTLLLESGFKILNHESIIGLTNCYIWTLSFA